MSASRTLLALPYNLARTPFAIVETTLLHRLDEQSPLRRAFVRGFGIADIAAGRVLNDQSLVRQGVERLTPAEPPRERTPSTAEPERTPEPEQAPEEPAASSHPTPRPHSQRAAATKRMQHDDSRSNKNVATIARDLARTEAIVEARDEQDSQTT